MSVTKFFHIAVLGPRGSGKTVFISSLFYAFIHLPSKAFSASFLGEEYERRVKSKLPQVLQTQSDDKWSETFLSENWHKLFVEQSFSKIEGTFCNWNLLLHLQSKYGRKNIVFYDIPGGWFSEEAEWDNHRRQIRARMQACDGAFLILDAMQLVENEWEYEQHLNTFLRTLDDVYCDKGLDLPVALVFTKCDHPAVCGFPQDKLWEKVQGILNRLEVKGQLPSPFGAFLTNSKQYRIFQVSAVGELEFNSEFAEGRPPKGGPVKNELFANLQKALQFLLEYRRQAQRQRAKKLGYAAIVLIFVGIIGWQLYSYQIWYRNGIYLQKKLGTKSCDLSLVANFSNFVDGKRNVIYNFFHKKHIENIRRGYRRINEKWGDQYWAKLEKKYSEADGNVTLSIQDYQNWQRDLAMYTRYFANFQNRALKLQRLLEWKILACRLLLQEQQQKQASNNLPAWKKIAANCQPLKKFVQKHIQKRQQQKISQLLVSLQRQPFPDPFLPELNRFLSIQEMTEFPPRIFALLEEKLRDFCKQAQEQDYDKQLAILHTIKTKIALKILLPKSTTSFGQYLDKKIERLRKEQDIQDYEQLHDHLDQHRNVIAITEQIRIYQKHLRQYGQLCQHRRKIEELLEVLWQRQDEEGYQKIVRWLHAGNRNNYQGLLKKIQLFRQQQPNIRRHTLIKLEKLQEQTRRYEVNSDFQEVKKSVQRDLARSLFSKAEQKTVEFVDRWRLKYDNYPEAEEIVKNYIQPLQRKIRTIWRKYDYTKIYDKLQGLRTQSGIRDTIELCAIFIRQHGFDQDVDRAKKFLEKIRNQKKYQIKLSHGKHLKNTWAVANLSVHIYVNGKKIFQSKEYDTNNPTWNETFTVEWKAFDEVVLRVMDTNGRDAWSYQDVSNKLLSITEMLEGVKKNHTVSISFVFFNAPKLYLPAPEKK